MIVKPVYTIGIDTHKNISNYESLRNELYAVIHYLDKCINNLNDFDLNLSKYYSVNDSYLEKVSIMSIKNELSSKLKYLDDIVIPSINSKIN